MASRKILIVGNGGREHALLWALARGEPDARFFITRGNGGTGSLATPIPLDPSEIQALAGWAEQEGIDLTVVGPEAPLDAGIVDHFGDRGLAAFGPTRAAARIESSKAFAKRLMADADVPTATFRVFRDPDEATGYIRELGRPAVVKASGLAAGKGAVVCDSVEETEEAARAMLADDAFGEAGHEIVVEERMEGEELSLFVLTDGTDLVPLLPTQDHKRIGEGDEGANTGGMGAYGPVSIATPELIDAAMDDIIRPTLDALRDHGAPYRGLLYAGLMLTSDGPRVVEFNCRFGDPETQALMPLLADPIGPVLEAIARGGSIRGAEIRAREGASVTTVLASEGYPGEYRRGIPVDTDGVEDEDGVFVFHAGTALSDSLVVTSGGRVLAVTALGPDVAAAAARSRSAAERIRFDGRYFRRDIGWREIERTAGTTGPRRRVPELPEVETIVRGIRPRILDRRFGRVEVPRPDLLGVEPAEFAAALRGRTVRRVRRRAKRIVMELSEGVLVITLGMTGRLTVRGDPGTELPHVGVRGSLDDGHWMIYQDARRFGSLRLLSDDEWAALEARIGLEPLGDALTVEAFGRLRSGVRAPVKNWLMDQRVIAGVGNIYASEALFRAGIHPRRAAGRISAKRARLLRHEVREVLREAIESRGTTLLDYRDAAGEPGEFAGRLRVYNRAGEPCPRCDRPIRRIVQAGRSTFYCAGCQR